MESNVRQPGDLPRQALLDIVEHLQQHLFLDMAGCGDPFVKGVEFWNPDKRWDVELFESLADKLTEYGLRPEQATLRASASQAVEATASFTKRYAIQDVLNWELYKNRLRPMLVDITASDDDCPDDIKASDWQGEIEVDGDDLVVTILPGEGR
jgi:hypothetical protein